MDAPHPIRPLPSLATLIRHITRSAALAIAVVAASLGLGTLGYHAFEHLSWLDAELNAAMILTGMGPVDRPLTVGGKLFASAYALFSGLAFLSSAALLFTPLAKRALHRLHLDMHARPAAPPPNR